MRDHSLAYPSALQMSHEKAIYKSTDIRYFILLYFSLRASDGLDIRRGP